MAKIAPSPGVLSLSAVDAKLAALAKLEALSEELGGEAKRSQSDHYVREAVQAWRQGDFDAAGQAAMRATEIDETNARAFHILAMYLERLGHLHKALITYEHAFQLDPNDPELLINLGTMAWKLKLDEGAAKMFQLYIASNPDSPLGYNNLGTIQSEMGNREAAIETLRGALFRMPDQSILWNALATVLAESGRAEESLVFYQEAIRLEPTYARFYHNLGYAYQHLDRLDEANAAYEKALEYVLDSDEARETKHSRSLCLIGMGRLKEGFADHECRREEQFRAYLHHMIDAPYWNGEPVDGKRVLIVAEQGLGDEIMFAEYLSDVQRLVGPNGKLQIAVDPRLVSLFQRSWPDAEVGCYEDRSLLNKDGNNQIRFVPFATEKGQPDYYAWMASPLGWLRSSIGDFPHKAFLKPDPQRVEEFRTRLAGSGLKVGICWRSMLIDVKRAKYFSALDQWGPLLKTPGVRFINMQYGDCTDELKRAEEMHGVKIETIDGLDLKNDLEGAAAASACLDVMISAPTASAAIAAAVGTETWFLLAGSRAWPQLGTDHYPWYPKTRAFSPSAFGDWDSLMPQLADTLKERASE
jgi:Flp pilus assembly protein TadD